MAKLIIYSLSGLESLKGPLRFCNFPTEIRHMILEWVLIEDAQIHFEPYSHVGY
jgi:hypothetical protein